MKQYTNAEQTAKLIESGFEKPSSIASVEPIRGMGGISVAKAYSIGELIEMLPEAITLDDTKYSRVISKNEVYYYSWIFEVYHHIFDLRDELIDNLFDMCVKLKAEGVI